MVETFLSVVSLIVVVATSISVLIAMKKLPRMAETIVFQLKDDVFDWIHSEEGMTEVAFVGKLFGAGVMSTIKLPRGRKPMKLTGIPLLDNIIEGVIVEKAPKFLKGVIPGGERT